MLNIWTVSKEVNNGKPAYPTYRYNTGSLGLVPVPAAPYLSAAPSHYECYAGGLILGVIQHFKGGEIRLRLAHRIAIVLPLIIATTVNLGVAPFLFAQVLYGQFLYTSSVLMGFVWILVIPVLIVAYYGAYLYDFRFVQLGRAGIWIGTLVSFLLLAIGWAFSNNMLLMLLPGTYAGYFDHMNGTLLATGYVNFLPRYLHMMLGSIAIGDCSLPCSVGSKLTRIRSWPVMPCIMACEVFSSAPLSIPWQEPGTFSLFQWMSCASFLADRQARQLFLFSACFWFQESFMVQ
ncbi:hypothetical protein [Desulfomarina profundi]|uniref:hypothetical protein n=1 Tax=Desulfomarina profundi TaxID=2772557 RepID=UPI001E3973A5|nr:hypothetical protein [Desulfomarina profundi]